MLDATLIVDATVAALQSIDTVVQQMMGDPNRIEPFYFAYAADEPLLTAIAKMLSPSMLVAWEGSGPGRMTQMTVWQHRLAIYFRTASAAKLPDAANPMQLWRLAMTSPVNGGTLDFRKTAILDSLYPIDTPTVTHEFDVNGLDYFCGHLIFTEIGDQ